jgi:hypothetical protein
MFCETVCCTAMMRPRNWVGTVFLRAVQVSTCPVEKSKSTEDEKSISDGGLSSKPRAHPRDKRLSQKIKSVEELFVDIPKEVRIDGLRLPNGLSEIGLKREVESMMAVAMMVKLPPSSTFQQRIRHHLP